MLLRSSFRSLKCFALRSLTLIGDSVIMVQPTGRQKGQKYTHSKCFREILVAVYVRAFVKKPMATKRNDITAATI